jgi:large subunit ribosomal protein L17
MAQRKLGRPASERKALLRNQVTALLWNGKIETTLYRAKEVRRMAERLVTLAVREYDKTEQVTKEYYNDKGQVVSIEVTNDLPSKLHARRRMMAYLYNVKPEKEYGESKSGYFERTKDVKNPVVEKLFREYGPKYRKRNEEKNAAGGYTRIYRLGPRRGDGAEMVIIEMV